MTNLRHNYFFCTFLSVLYMFRATSCSSSGESIVSIQRLVYVTLCRWPSSVQVAKERSFFPACILGIYKKEMFVKLVIYRRNHEKHGQQNIKFKIVSLPKTFYDTDHNMYLQFVCISPRRYPYFDVVVGLVWSHDPKSYAGGSLCYW
jgi:hypothetical protein